MANARITRLHDQVAIGFPGPVWNVRYNSSSFTIAVTHIFRFH
jgi:hypothetical protein